MANNGMTGLTYKQVKALVMGFLASGDTDTVLYIEGHQGIGKTELLMHCIGEFFGGTEWAKKDLRKYTQKELPFYYGQEYPATKQVEDYTGIPFNVDGRARWACDERFPLKGSGPDGVDLVGGYVLEELNQADEQVLKAMFPLLQDKQIAGHVLSPRVHLFITGNPANSIHHVSDFPPALKDRMQRIGMVHSATDWLEWARESGIHEAVTAFIEENPSMLWMMPEDGSAGPTPRAWASVSSTLHKLDKGFLKEYMVVELLKNKVGDKVATKFLGYFKHEFKRAVNAEDLFASWDTALPRYKKQHAAGKAETLDSCLKWVTERVKPIIGKTKAALDVLGGSTEMAHIAELMVEHTPEAVFMTKFLTLEQEVGNTLAACAPNGQKLIRHAIGIRLKADSAKQAADAAQKEKASNVVPVPPVPSTPAPSPQEIVKPEVVPAATAEQTAAAAGTPETPKPRRKPRK